MKFQVEVWSRSRDGDEQIKVNEAVFRLLAIDSSSPSAHWLLVELINPLIAEGLFWVEQ